jgi:hypothetical protein
MSRLNSIVGSGAARAKFATVRSAKQNRMAVLAIDSIPVSQIGAADVYWLVAESR